MGGTGSSQGKGKSVSFKKLAARRGLEGSKENNYL